MAIAIKVAKVMAFRSLRPCERDFVPMAEVKPKAPSSFLRNLRRRRNRLEKQLGKK